MSALPDVLELDDLGPGRFQVHQGISPENRDVVFSGQLLAQMIMAADKVAGGQKEPKSIHAIFARAGTYTQPIQLTVESLHAGRTWASDTVTAAHGDRLLSRGIVLQHADEPDLMRHSSAMPKVSSPDDVGPGGQMAFPGAEIRTLPDPPDGPGGVPGLMFWHRYTDKIDSVAGNAAVLSWATCGQFIGLAMRNHRDKVDISQAHKTISTGVIGQTINFHERIDVSQWLLLTHEATYAGRGRVHGRGQVFTQDGDLVATFTQDAMARMVEGELDPMRAM